jgi:hypothetical protein
LCTCRRQYPGAAAGRRLRSSHPAVSAFPDTPVGSACTSSLSKIARRSLTLRPVHSRRPPIRGPLSEGFGHFVTSMTAPVASGWSELAGWGLHPLEKRRLITAHVESRCGAVTLGANISVSAPFVWRCLTSSPVVPFPHPSHRTGRAELPHPALGQDIMPSPTTGRALARSDARARSARKGARVDRSRSCVV